ncbi:hypothetical protein ACFE04_019241 [Oxalis oulophora]
MDNVQDLDSGEGNDVKESCRDQREALPGEPRCVICNRYGEYICDETDDDICSLECKKTLLSKLNKVQLPVDPPPVERFPATDDCFYVRDSNSSSESLSPKQTEALRKKLEIHIKGHDNNIPAPILSFSSLHLPQRLLQNLEASGFDIPTPVQMQAIPVALADKSLLVSADTGSGKTASFLVPIIANCAKFCDGQFLRKPLAVVLAPTRELCIQIEDQAKLFAKGLPFKTALVVGGDVMPKQLYRIQQGVQLMVATPGRLIDLLAKHDVELNDVKTFVLDEVDCMLQKGFQDQVMQIFTALPQAQVLMFSATITPEVEKMASSMAKGIIFISIGKPNQPSKSVKQLAIWVESKNKKKKLFDIITSKQHFQPPTVIYVNSRIGADLLSNAITVTTGVKALSIHGEKPMKERREIMKSFLIGEVLVMVATGVLGRGVDLLGVRQVIVFDMPNSMREYVHQIGRASRLGEEGTAIVFVNEENRNLFPELVETLKASGAVVPRELVNSSIITENLPPGVLFWSSLAVHSIRICELGYVMNNGTTYMGETSSSASWSSSQQDTKDDQMIAAVLSEEYANLDGSFARHVPSLAPVPHVPRINTFFPKLSDAGLDHQRLLERLRVYGLCEVKVSGDGNCQFRAISDQMYRSPEHHKHIRKEVVKQLKDHHTLYESYIPMKYKRYYKKMAKSGEWGDHVTLQAAADKFAAKICLLTSFRDTCFIEIMPQYQAPKRELWLSFWSEVHYNSLYKIQAAVPVQPKPKKKHWLF